MARHKAHEELAESVLEAAGSFFHLEEELDRISLHQDSDSEDPRRRRHKKHSKHNKKKKTLAEQAAANERRRKEEDRSNLDAVSFQSSDSLDHSFSASSSSRYDSAIGSLHSQTDNDSISSSHHTAHRQPLSPQQNLSSAGQSSSQLGQPIVAKVEHYFSPRISLPTLILAPDPTTDLTQEEKASSHEMTVMGTQVQLRQNKSRMKQKHKPLTAEDARKHFQWLEQESNMSLERRETQSQKNPQKPYEIDSEGSSSTVIADGESIKEILDDEYLAAIESDSSEIENSLPHKKTDSVQQHMNMPQRYQTTSYQGRARQRATPRRTHSILQRLKRKQGSFRQPAQQQQQQRSRVQRSLSDRFVYHLKKWETNTNENSNEYPISTPSSVRPIGRLYRTYAGRLHLVQLHRLSDGQFGIYISQKGNNGKIFISRFANATAEKFYAGLLRPGDELVSVNKVKIRGKSLDFVYSLLSELDSVIVAVVPVTAHRNW